MESKVFEARTLEECLSMAALHFKTKPENLGFSVIEKKDAPMDIALERTYFKISVFILTPTLKKVGKLIDSTINDVFDSIADIPDISDELKEKLFLEQPVIAVPVPEQTAEIPDGFSAGIKGILFREEDGGLFIRNPRHPEVEMALKPSGDNMLLLCCKTAGVLNLGLEDILLFLADRGIVHGIKKEVLIGVLTTPEELVDKVVAAGDKPVDGKDAKLTFHESFDDKDRYIGEDGKIDFHMVCYVKKIEAGELILSIRPCIQGKEGRDIFGNVIRVYMPEDTDIQAGENVRTHVNQAGEIEFWAEVTGNVTFDRNVLSVSEALMIPGDVDFKVGNLNFDGVIIIEGNVLDTFKVECTKDLSVRQNIRAAMVRSGGSIMVKGGIISRDKGEVCCEGNLYAKYIDSGKVFVNGKVEVEKEIMHSKVCANGKIECIRGAGKIIGGVIQSYKGIDCNILGSEYGILTEVLLGEDFSIKRFAEEIRPKLADIKEKLEKLDHMKRRFKKLISGESDLPEIMRDKLAILYSHEKVLKKQMMVMLKQLEQKKVQNVLFLDAQVIVRKKIYPPVIVLLGKCKEEITRPLSCSRIYYCPEQKRILVKPLVE